MFAADSDPFCCSICLERFKDPVSVPCGHSFCMSCLTEYWDQRRAATCPQCRAAFSPRPRLGRNVLLVEMMQKLRTNEHGPSAPPMHEVLGPSGPHGFDHATFDVSSVQPTRNPEQRLVEETRRHVAVQIQENELEMKQLKKTMRSYIHLAHAAAQDNSRIFSELLDSLKRRRDELNELMAAQQNAEVTRAENHLQRLARETSELRRRDGELERLAQCQDQSLVTQMCASLLGPPVPADGSRSWTFSPHVSFGPVRKAVVDLKEQIQTLYQTQFPAVASAVKNVKLQKIEKEPKEVCVPASLPALDSRSHLMQYFCELSFDPFTAHKELSLLEGNRTARRAGELHPYPDHPDRFDTWGQALCREGLQGRCYWEAEWDGQAGVGLAYESIKRKGSSDGCRLGYNCVSWCLQCGASSLSFWHSKQALEVSSGGPPPRRLGVFLDHGAGVLCFFSVTPSDVQLLHRLESRFSEPLYPAVWLASRAAVSLCTADSL